MSMCYWMIEGIGLCASSLEPHLVTEVRFQKRVNQYAYILRKDG